MPSNRRETFEKRQRDKARRDKAAAKRAKKAMRSEEGVDGEPTEDEAVPAGPSQDVVLAELAALHAAYDDERISFDDFEEKRAQLLARLTIE